MSCKVKSRLAAVTEILPLGATSMIQIQVADLNSKAFSLPDVEDLSSIILSRIETLEDEMVILSVQVSRVWAQ